MGDAQQPPARAAIKERRAQDAARAKRDYEAQKLADLAKIDRLRALRLAKEAETALHKDTRKAVKEER
jgi:hypothetical protein